jgi:hypothetical protein
MKSRSVRKLCERSGRRRHRALRLRQRRVPGDEDAACSRACPGAPGATKGVGLQQAFRFRFVPHHAIQEAMDWTMRQRRNGGDRNGRFWRLYCVRVSCSSKGAVGRWGLSGTAGVPGWSGSARPPGKFRGRLPATAQRRPGGFVVVRGERSKLDAMVASDEFLRITMRAQIVVDSMRVVNVSLGQEVERQMDTFLESAAELSK